MFNLGGTGMGTTGLGMAGGGGQPGGGMSPQQIMMMLQGAGGGMQPAATPFQQGGAQTPMSNYLGHPPMMGGMSGGAPAMPVGQGPQPAVIGAGGAGGAQGGPGAQNIMQMLAALKGQQTGVQGAQGVQGMAPGAGGAGSMIPAWLQAMLHSGSYGATGAGMAPAVGPGGMQGGGV